jgi:hypothetical protein
MYGSNTIKGDTTMITDETELIIPDYDPYEPKPYPGDIKLGSYSVTKVKKLLNKHGDNLAALRFIRDMLEE